MSNYFNLLIAFFTVDLWVKFEEFYQWLAMKFIVWTIDFSIWQISNLETYVNAVIVEFNLVAFVEQAYSVLPDDMAAYLTILQVPQALSIILASIGVGLALRFLGRFF